MAKRSLHVGATSHCELVRITDMNGSPITGLVFNSTGLAAAYILSGAAPVDITLITQTVAGAFSSGGFIEINATKAPGLYRLDIPDAAFASGSKSVVTMYGYSGMNVSMLEYDLWAINPQDAVRLGLSSLPNGSLTVKKNAQLANYPFPVFDSTTHQMATGKTITAQRSIDGGALANCANAVTEVGSGLYKITLAASDLNGDTIFLKFSGTGCDDLPQTILTQP